MSRPITTDYEPFIEISPQKAQGTDASYTVQEDEETSHLKEKRSDEMRVCIVSITPFVLVDSAVIVVL
jgi:hypothetical protein